MPVLQQTPLGEFRNNTVHSQGWFGIWIFQEYTPMTSGACSDNTPKAAKLVSNLMLLSNLFKQFL